MEPPLRDAPQRFVISHHNEADFKTGGLRDYSAYRDLGVAAATNGLAKAHVIRMIAPFRAVYHRLPSISAIGQVTWTKTRAVS